MVRRSRSSSTSSSSSSTSSSAGSSTSSSTSTASSPASKRRGSPRRSPRRRSVSVEKVKESSPQNRVAVTNLSRNVTREHVLEIFGIYGPIKDMRFPMNSRHPYFPRGDAVLEYEKREDAEKALKHMDGGQIDGMVVNCEWQPPTPPPRRRSPIRKPLSPKRRSPPRRSRSPVRRSRSRSPIRRRSPPFRRGRSPRRSPPRRFRRSPPRRSPRRSPPNRRITGGNNVPIGRRRSDSP
uniref:RRM domain-containing protein n=2 Tax=Panagrolaimus sp. JU765 TaxID=591449 RepID=A0AC34QZ51_9BILA